MKDKSVAGILALFLGGFGVHRFYLEQTGLGIFYLIFCWFPVMWIVGWIDAIVFLSMDKENFDYKYNRYPAYRRDRQTDFERKNYRRYENNRYERREERREERKEFRQERRRQELKRNPVRETPTPRRNNPFKLSGIKKYKEYDYDEAIEDFKKALEIEPKDIAVHFNLACSYSLNENAERAFYHLDKAVEYGFNDFKRIKEHDALAFLRIQDEFEDFERNGFRTIQKLEAPPQQQDLLSTDINLLDQLKKLGELRDKGLLTEEEFSIQKKKLLG